MFLRGSIQFVFLAIAALSLTGCGKGDENNAPSANDATASSLTATTDAATTDANVSVDAAAQPSPPTAEQLAAWQACAERRKHVLTQPALAGAPSFEEHRVHLARVRGRSLLWRRVPQTASSVLAERVAKNDKALGAVKGILRKFKNRRSRRKILLREGYLYAEQVDVALALVEQIGLTHLFSEQTVFLRRGVDIHELHRKKRTRYKPKRYEYQSGPLRGETAELLFGDRVAKKRKTVEQDPLAIDLRDLERHSDIDRLRVEHFTAKALAADVRYGPGVWVPAVIDLAGAQARVGCEVLTAELAHKKADFVTLRQLSRTAMRRIRQVVRAMVLEKPPFDAAPEQKDGFMRKAWRRAYFKKWRRFTLEDRKYDVYNTDGKPIPPQVCIDFLIDVWERAGGKWFAPLSGDPPRPHPALSEGPIDFSKLGTRNRRSVVEFVRLTKRHPELFDTWDIPKKERFRFKERDKFFNYLAAQADQFQHGDMLIIHGYKKGGRPHYHSLIIMEKDLITGVPTRVAGNAVFPREQTLEGIMQISPKRTLRNRIRVLMPWLEHVAAKAGPTD